MLAELITPWIDQAIGYASIYQVYHIHFVLHMYVVEPVLLFQFII